jgi:hypothetical protein
MVAHDADGSNDDAGASGSLLDAIVRDGARQMLAAALQAGLAAYIEQFADQVDDNGHRLVVRNGCSRRAPLCLSDWAIRVSDFRSGRLPARCYAACGSAERFFSSSRSLLNTTRLSRRFRHRRACARLSFSATRLS